jgi:hypothetical protein
MESNDRHEGIEEPNIGKCEYCNDLGEIGTLNDYSMMTVYEHEYERRRTLPIEERLVLDVMDSTDDDELYGFFRIISDVMELPTRGQKYYINLRLRLCKDLNIKTAKDLVTKSYSMYGNDHMFPEDEISDRKFNEILKCGALWLVNRYKRCSHDSNLNPDATTYQVESDYETELETTVETTFDNDENNITNNDEISVPVIEAIIMNATSKVKSTDIWLGDTGASTHMTNNDDGMLDCKKINSSIKVVDGKSIKATKLERKG